MGTQKFFRDGRFIGDLTVDGTLTASSGLTASGDLTASGGLTLSSGLTQSINLVSSSEDVVAGGFNGFSDTGKGRHTHLFASAPVLGQVMECFNVIASGSSVTHKLLSSTEFGAVTINSSLSLTGRGIVLGTSNGNGNCRLVGVSTAEWQVLNLQNATVVAGTSV